MIIKKSINYILHYLYRRKKHNKINFLKARCTTVKTKVDRFYGVKLFLPDLRFLFNYSTVIKTHTHTLVTRRDGVKIFSKILV